jgi:hypothetical protein
MKVTRLIALSAALTCLSFAAYAQERPAPKDALLYFVWPQNGATIKGGVLVPLRSAQHGSNPCGR